MSIPQNEVNGSDLECTAFLTVDVPPQLFTWNLQRVEKILRPQSVVEEEKTAGT